MKKTQKKPPTPAIKAAPGVTVTERLDREEQLPPFILKKIADAKRIIAIAGLPK